MQRMQEISAKQAFSQQACLALSNLVYVTFFVFCKECSSTTVSRNF